MLSRKKKFRKRRSKTVLAAECTRSKAKRKAAASFSTSYEERDVLKSTPKDAKFGNSTAVDEKSGVNTSKIEQSMDGNVDQVKTLEDEKVVRAQISPTITAPDMSAMVTLASKENVSDISVIVYLIHQPIHPLCAVIVNLLLQKREMKKVNIS